MVSTVTIDQHAAACPRCRLRLKREAKLDRIRRRSGQKPVSFLPGTAVYTSMPSPLGTLWIACGEEQAGTAARAGTAEAGPYAGFSRGLISIDYGVDELTFCRRVEARGHGMPEYAPWLLEDVVAQLSEYFNGTRTNLDMPVDLTRATPFQRQVLEEVRRIPYGSVASYGDIAHAVGKPAAARAVGSAVATNPVSMVIPCHRVVRGDGSIGEYALRTLGSCGVEYKRVLLAIEGSRF